MCATIDFLSSKRRSHAMRAVSLKRVFISSHSGWHRFTTLCSFLPKLDQKCSNHIVMTHFSSVCE